MLFPIPIRAPLCPCILIVLSLVLQAADTVPFRTVTLEECLRRVVERSPELRSGTYRTEAAVRRAGQAAQRLNPRLEAEVENAAGSGTLEGFESAETTVAVSQEIELGGKRRHRTAVAEAEAAASRAEQEARLRTLLSATRRAALGVQSAQAKARLAEDVLALVRETESAAVALEQAGKVTVLEAEQARAETAKAEIELEAVKAEQRDAVRELALLWGETEPGFDAVAEAFDGGTPPLPPLDPLLAAAAANPELLAAEAQVRAHEARIGAERAARVPNLELSAGVRRFEDGGDVAIVAGAGIELPFRTRNLEGVRAAEAEAEAARLDAIVARLTLEGRIRQLHAQMGTLAAKAARLRTTVVPVAERTLSLVREAHQQGKAGYLEVLEARRTLAEARLNLIETLTEYRSAGIELERLTN
jgi:cobalt-zinc-cadmium efflux system outer membrane protein